MISFAKICLISALLQSAFAAPFAEPETPAIARPIQCNLYEYVEITSKAEDQAPKLTKAASAGLDVSVAYTQTRGEALDKTIGCPAGAFCKLVAINHMYRVTGRRHTTGPDSICKERDSEPYSILLPKTVPDVHDSVSAEVSYSGCFSVRPAKPVEGYDYEDCPKA
ncbi:MAG: hypothetical protein M1814_002486 [Vezdaea aestivalis]|nr:MAG: hypothetical protein M1814_002486 [Vezdaea aestivalis]